MNRRTRLRRVTPLVARKGLQRRVPLREVGQRSIAKGKKPKRDTGPDRATRELAFERDLHACAWCGKQLLTGPRSLQHRQARGMGGRTDPSVNRPSNLIWLCGTATTPGGCHLFAEQRSEEARVAGLWVPSWQDPARVPVLHAAYGVVLLADDGTVARLGEAA